MKVLLFSLCLILFSSCNSQVKSNNDMDINLKFYPTGAEKDLRYSIVIIDDSLFVINYLPRNKNQLKDFKRLITQKEKKSIYELLSKVKKNDISNLTKEKEDTWAVRLKINNEIIYVTEDFLSDVSNSNIKKLIDYLIKLSPIKIDLYGFS